MRSNLKSRWETLCIFTYRQLLIEVLFFQVDDQMKLLQDSWSEMLILDHMHHRMHNNLPDETQLPNGQVRKLFRNREPVKRSSLLKIEPKLFLFWCLDNVSNYNRILLTGFFFACAEVWAFEPCVAGSSLDGREVPRDLGQPQATLLRLRGLRLLEIHPLTQCR